MNTRFVCENCGKDVPYNAQACSFCGRFFSGVKCPVCNASGRAELFKNGCPNCGYLTPKMANLNSPYSSKGRKRKKMKKKGATTFYLLFGMLLIMALSIIFILIIKNNL